jgi:hypothetical protein
LLLIVFTCYDIDELTSVLVDCENLCNDLSTDDTVKKSQWEKRSLNNEANWENCREELFSAVLGSLVVPDDEVVCMLCQKECAVIKCSECKLQYLCPGCDDVVHTDNPLHDREYWSKGFFHYLPPTQGVSYEGKLIYKGITN